MKKLIIVESPTKARTISRFLQDDAEVLATMGHICDIPSDGMNVDLNTFVPHYVINSGKSKIVAKMKKELQDSDELYLATDEDREGESISYHIYNELKPQIPTKRMVFHEITKSAILHALDNTRDIDMNAVNAQEARRVLDRVFGYEVSPLLWKYLGQNHLSAGRVQSPTLRLVVEREYARLNFKSVPYYVIKAIFENASGEQYEASITSINGKIIAHNANFFDPETGELTQKDAILLDEESANKYIERMNISSYQITDIQQKERHVYPPAPYITSTLQQDGNSTFHISAKDIMKIAQDLYEHGLITYMRTDSPTLSTNGVFAARRSVETSLGPEHLSPSPRVFHSKDQLAQEAHEAIRPAILDNRFKTSAELGLKDYHAKIYDMIYARTLSSQMNDNIRLDTVVTISNTSPDAPQTFVFQAKGSVNISLGFKVLYKTDNDETTLPALKVGEDAKLVSLDCKKSVTQPPKRYTEASLIRQIEKLGIGRPSTYATIVSTLLKKRYIVEQGNSLIPTFLGFAIILFLSKHISKFIDYDYTSKMESSLDEIEENRNDKFAFLNDFYRGSEGLVNLTRINADNSKDETIIPLPALDKTDYNIYLGKYGAYIDYNGENYSIPSNVYPYQIDVNKIQDIISNKEENDDKLIYFAKNTQTGADINFNPKGKYGAYFSCIKDGKNVYFSLPRSSKVTDWSAEEVTRMFNLPITLGSDNDGNTITISSGRYGGFISSSNGVNASYKDIHKLLNLTLSQAIDILKKEGKAKQSGAKSLKRFYKRAKK